MKLSEILMSWTVECEQVEGEELSCRATNRDGLECTRRRGHGGRHHAHGGLGDNRCFDCWVGEKRK